jgi:hypothetical protein
MNLVHRTEADMTHFLSKRYCAPHYAFLAQVRNGTGFQRRTTRTADALAMSLWPSRGIHLNGFEIKVSLSDFRSEVKNPEKAEDIAQHCHFWWICAPNIKVAPLELMPANWGLLVLDDAGEKLEVAKDPVFNPHALPPDWLMFASIMRNAGESCVPLSSLDNWKETYEKNRRESDAVTMKNELARLGSKAKELIEKEAKLREVFDDYDTWNSDRFVAKYKLAKELLDTSRHPLALFDTLIEACEKLKPVIAELRGKEDSA